MNISGITSSDAIPSAPRLIDLSSNNFVAMIPKIPTKAISPSADC